jgi:hypothetical protein
MAVQGKRKKFNWQQTSNCFKWSIKAKRIKVNKII